MIDELHNLQEVLVPHQKYEGGTWVLFLNKYMPNALQKYGNQEGFLLHLNIELAWI